MSTDIYIKKSCLHCEKIYDSKKYSESNYCSRTCSHAKHTEQFLKNNIEKYLLNQKKCMYCSYPISYDKRTNNFCNKSCSANYNNSLRNPTATESNNKRRLTLINRYKREYDKTPSMCNMCNIALDFAKRKKKYCDNCIIQLHNIPTKLGNKLICNTCAVTGEVFYAPTYKKYSSTIIYEDRKQYYNACKFKFNVYHRPDRFNLSLLEIHGWYHPINNPNGVSRDHMFSVSDGWKSKIVADIMSHPANCRLVLHKDNQRKKSKSSITLDELHSLIMLW
jgi:hypothetical protein